MTNRFVNALLVIFFCAGLGLTIRAHAYLSKLTTPPEVPSNPKRIVSLAPSITETLYALGQGDQVVGVTNFCNYPPEAQLIPKVAGFNEVNFEAVLRTNPDLVILPIDKLANRQELDRLGLSTTTMDTRDLERYMDSVIALGRTTNYQNQAELIVGRIQGALNRAASRAAGRPRPRVLFVVMHSYQGFGYISEITAVGRDGFFDRMLTMAGGENVYQGALSFPKLSREAIMTLNPDVVVDLLQGPSEIESAMSDWMGLGDSVGAVRNNRINLFTETSDTVPGPRIHSTIDKLSLAFFPENP
ncbi:MAG: helical backbone metal receptor [Deltaproteobacteria bacterium]|jgi:iron complex transport system substrate-binding protein|nr:helical backbone metal receptor [Deltaproteobacteria bacterium]